MIVFENNGEIDFRAIHLFGVSVKDNDNPIGFFGTGLKYAISVLLRKGQNIKIYSGTDTIEFKAVEEVFRDEPISIVYAILNGTPISLGFTTRLGINWDLWMAYRELSCNCIDEGGKEWRAEATIPFPGCTKVVVSGDEFENIFAERSKYILQDSPDIYASTVNIIKRTSDFLYFKGVRVFELNSPSRYTYNVLSGVTLTEDRTLTSEYTFRSLLSKAYLTQVKDTAILRDIISAVDFYEENLDFDGWGSDPSNEFLDAVEFCVKHKFVNTNGTAISLLKTKRPVAMESYKLTKVQEKMLTTAISFCKKIGYNVDEYPITTVEELGGGCIGLAKDYKIFLALQCFTNGGTKLVASTLIEEFIHLKHGHCDMSRGLQNHLLDKIVSLGEELIGDPI